MPGMTIGRLAESTGVGVETIRFYERCGLIDRPQRPLGRGFREYDAETAERIRFVRQAQQLGFSLGEIRELLALRATPGVDCRAVRAQAVAKRDEVDGKIDQLRRIRKALDELIATCPGGGALRSCTILDALERPPPRTGARRVRSQARLRAPPHRTKAPTKGNRVKTTTLSIEGMHCEGCAQTLKFLLGREAGVRKVDVSFADAEARIMHDPQTSDKKRLAAVVKKAGFRAGR